MGENGNALKKKACCGRPEKGFATLVRWWTKMICRRGTAGGTLEEDDRASPGSLL